MLLILSFFCSLFLYVFVCVCIFPSAPFVRSCFVEEELTRHFFLSYFTFSVLHSPNTTKEHTSSSIDEHSYKYPIICDTHTHTQQHRAAQREWKRLKYAHITKTIQKWTLIRAHRVDGFLLSFFRIFLFTSLFTIELHFYNDKRRFMQWQSMAHTLFRTEFIQRHFFCNHSFCRPFLLSLSLVRSLAFSALSVL